MKQSEMQQIAAMVAEMMQKASTPTEPIVTMQASKLPEGLIDAAKWLKKNGSSYSTADRIEWSVYQGTTYFRLYCGKAKLGAKNRRLWGGGKSSDWGTVPLKGKFAPLA